MSRFVTDNWQIGICSSALIENADYHHHYHGHGVDEDEEEDDNNDALMATTTCAHGDTGPCLPLILADIFVPVPESNTEDRTTTITTTTTMTP